MATTARQPKSNRKPMPEPAARRAPAWGGARASPTFSPNNAPARLAHSPSPAPTPTGAFPPLGQAGSPASNGAPVRNQGEPDRNVQALAGLTGTTVTVTTRTGSRYEGVVLSTAREGDTTGVTLKDARDVNIAGAPIKDNIFVAATNIASWASGPADAKPANGDTFKTDVDISQMGVPRRERELQAWADDSTGLDLSSRLSGGATSPSGATAGHGHTDDLTFGLGASARGGNAWDQFATNEKLFGVKTGFDEDLYTTKLDRSAPDFKERERKAQQIANEIMGSTSSNPHVAEERNQSTTDDSGVNEEDKYGAVVRSANAYVPPGARKTAAASAAAAAAVIPKVSVNGPDGAAPSPPPTLTTTNTVATSSSAATKQPADAVPAFRSFVTNERQRLTQKKQALVKNEMAARMADLMKFSQTFKLNKPIPEDLVPILAKDEEKQKQIREKSTKDAESAAARAIAAPGSTASVSPSPSGQIPSSSTANPIKLDATHAKAGGLPPSVSAKAIGAAAGTPTMVAPATKDGKPAVEKKPSGRPVMAIQAIPPFKGKKIAPLPVVTSAQVQPGAAPTPPLSPNSARLNANASSFRPNPNAAAFNPTPSPSVTSPPAKAESPPQTAPQPNPFFGTKPMKKGNPVSIRDDFNPFKYNKVADASAVGAIWPYNGKRYSALYPPTPIPPVPTQSSPHMAPPPVVPQQAPPAQYEGDPNAQQQPAHPGGYVYAYPYGYPGAPMMPGMHPPGPPGPYMPGPYMQPMHYPPPMAPNGQPMYASPSMGQMPPPGPYMAPPPGAYPPPPNGAGPRPPMPTTPIPAHAHPYYQPSPQLQHAVPYQMMMPPPPGPNVQQHPYEGAPQPVPMGGVGHA